jgi:UDP-N-acetylglucosamine 1-carboxyvinyltransferase
MEKLKIEGGFPLAGSLRVQGAKNAILPILAASILNSGKTVLFDCPYISDVEISERILCELGVATRREKETFVVDSSTLNSFEISEDLMREMRSSIVFLGAILAKMGRSRLSMPGGCELGPRPIDLHLKALRQMGVTVVEEHGFMDCRAEKLHGAKIYLDFPSVGATENIMLAAVLAEGETIIANAAKEPEIVDLQDFLNCMGAEVVGAGGSVIRITGVKKLHDAQYRIMPDRIVAATFLAAACITKSEIELTNVRSCHIESILSVLSDMGSKLFVESSRVIHIPGKQIYSVGNVRTMPYPGFPTDAQSPFMAASTLAHGSSIFIENIFESRYKHVGELIRMGADITVDGSVAVVRGVDRLTGARVAAMDLRGGAALIVAALAAEGTTEITGVHYIDRGYERIEENFSSLGAKIAREEETCPQKRM